MEPPGRWPGRWAPRAPEGPRGRLRRRGRPDRRGVRHPGEHLPRVADDGDGGRPQGQPRPRAPQPAFATWQRRAHSALRSLRCSTCSIMGPPGERGATDTVAAMTLVWLPDDDWSEHLSVPPGLTIEVWRSGLPLPASVGDVAFYVPEYMGPAPTLEVMQAHAGPQGCPDADRRGRRRARPTCRDGVTLCNAAGVHDASTAELAVGLAIASPARVSRIRAGTGRRRVAARPARRARGSTGRAPGRRLGGIGHRRAACPVRGRPAAWSPGPRATGSTASTSWPHSCRQRTSSSWLFRMVPIRTTLVDARVPRGTARWRSGRQRRAGPGRRHRRSARRAHQRTPACRP